MKKSNSKERSLSEYQYNSVLRAYMDIKPLDSNMWKNTG